MRKQFDLLSLFDRYPGLLAGVLLLNTLLIVILVVVVMRR